jgi:RNA polymerase subunit RPABC4/transcription elongation factor Spt4
MSTKACIACAEQIQEAAQLCRYCNTEQNDPRFVPQTVNVVTSSAPKSPNYVSRLTKKIICPVCNKFELESEYYSKCEVCRGVIAPEVKAAQEQVKESIANEKAAAEIRNPSYSPNILAPASSNSILAFAIALFIPIVGLILGYSARNEIIRAKGKLGGDGFALAAIVIGWLWIAVGTFWLIVFASISTATRYY